MAIDPTPISGAAGLVKSHSITQDSETTVMRTGDDMQATASFIARQETKGRQNDVLRSVFRMNGVSRVESGRVSQFRRDCGEFNRRDGELNG